MEPRSNKDHENCLLYQVSHYISGKNLQQRNIKSLDFQQNYLVLGGYCYIWSPEWSSTELAIHSHTPQPFFKLITGLFFTCKSNFNIFNGCKFSEILVSLFMCILNSPLVHIMGAQWVLPWHAMWTMWKKSICIDFVSQNHILFHYPRASWNLKEKSWC